jgi:nickel superoxide dismutase
MKATFAAGVAAVAFIVPTLMVSSAAAHCEMPCGIYTDSLRFSMMREDADTIEKAMKEIMELERKKPVQHHQLVRWIDTKEAHANKIQDVVSQYFLTQRIHEGNKRYVEQLKVLHQLLVTAMTCKQSTDLANVKKLRALIQSFEGLYFEKKGKVGKKVKLDNKGSR